MKLVLRQTCAASFIFFALAAISYPQVSLNAINTPYSQDFDTLAASGLGNTFTDNSTIPGWYSTLSAYHAGSGTNNAGTLYSFGTASSSTERALGSVAAGGTGTIHYGVRLKNDTGAQITSLDISFTGEQWRKSGVT
ncbi:MAG: endonuclease, partial [Acidobacteriota bacterium]|nr:endonuclease [Acidobacteriota bacterium]